MENMTAVSSSSHHRSTSMAPSFEVSGRSEMDRARA
jgi:hypothetical protein